MSALVTLGQLRSDLDERCDIENDLSFTQTEKDRLLNQGIKALYDDLVAAAPPDYYLQEATFVTTAGQASYPLPADFYKMRRVQVDESSGRRRSLYAMQPDERIMLQPPIDGQTARIEYIPRFLDLTAEDDMFNGVNGWEEMVVLWAAIKVYRKKGLTAGDLMAEFTEAKARVTRMANQDLGTAPTMVRISLRNLRWPWTANTITHYRIRAGEIELWKLDTLAPYP